MADLIIVLNSGSSSLKFTIYAVQKIKPAALPALQGLQALYDGQIERILTEPHFKAKDASGRVAGEREWSGPLGHEGAVQALFAWGREVLGGADNITAVGHRVVHGGRRFNAPAIITPQVLEELEKYVPLVPLHQPHNLAAIRIIADRRPGIPQVACFDTSFHTTIPEVAQAFGLPRQYTERGLRRYGFHGLSYEYIASVLPEYDPDAAKGRTVVAHLGSGASMCAVSGLKSIACTLGLTGLDGLIMGTRCGTLDPGVMLYLMDICGMDSRQIERMIYNESGLLGVSGISNDMRTLLESSDPRAAEAVELFVYRITRELGSLAAALGGLDALVFTGGIGENAAPVRERVCRGAQWLGVELDEKANSGGGPRITMESSRVRAWVIPTNEELMIATHTRRVLSGQ